MLWSELVLGFGIGLIVFAMAIAFGRREAGRAAAELESVTARLNVALSEIEDLRGRVAVLEKLATDDERKVAREIDKLRGTDTPSPA